MISLSEFIQYAENFFFRFYEFTNGIYPFSDYDVSLFWIIESLLLTSFAWSLFPVDTDFEDVYDEHSAEPDLNDDMSSEDSSFFSFETYDDDDSY